MFDEVEIKERTDGMAQEGCTRASREIREMKNRSSDFSSDRESLHEPGRVYRRWFGYRPPETP